MGPSRLNAEVGPSTSEEHLGEGVTRSLSGGFSEPDVRQQVSGEYFATAAFPHGTTTPFKIPSHGEGTKCSHQRNQIRKNRGALSKKTQKYCKSDP